MDGSMDGWRDRLTRDRHSVTILACTRHGFDVNCCSWDDQPSVSKSSEQIDTNQVR